MTETQRLRITDYLSGPRDYQEGVALYRDVGSNLRLKRVFAADDSLTTRLILHEELRKLAGLTQAEFDALPRRAHSSTRSSTRTSTRTSAHLETAVAAGSDGLSITVRLSGRAAGDPAAEPDIRNSPEGESRYSDAPPAVKKMISFRERYPFLNDPGCPDELKVIVADMITAYYRYREAHARLQEHADDATQAAARDAEAVVESYLDNRELREELDYYLEHGEMLRKASRFRNAEEQSAGDQPGEDLSALSEIDLMKRLNSAAANESKHRRALATARASGAPCDRPEAALARWSARKTALQQEVDRRKKKSAPTSAG